MHSVAILCRFAIACWLGGSALFTLILTPTLFRNLDRDTAGHIVGLLFPGYFRWGLACGAVAMLCLLLLWPQRRRVLPVVIVASMLAITAVQAYVIEPRAAALKQDIPSFITTPKDHPLRQQFRRLHGLSAAGNLAVIGGGAILLILL